jgi:hypothetical protein
MQAKAIQVPEKIKRSSLRKFQASISRRKEQDNLL